MTKIEQTEALREGRPGVAQYEARDATDGSLEIWKAIETVCDR